MRRWTAVLCGLTAVCASLGATAQSWTLFTPPEQDFRVVFPRAPARTDEAGGAVAFTAKAEGMEYVVYRRDPKRQPIGNAGNDIRQRLQRDADDERPVQRIGEEGDGPAGAEHAFRLGSRLSIHRVFVAPARYYELVVRAPRDELSDARRAGRDFYGTFQLLDAGALAAPAAAPGLAPDVMCQGRSNAFSRKFCEYRTCFQPGYEKHPYCAKLLGL